jgi:hypothetical protein
MLAIILCASQAILHIFVFYLVLPAFEGKDNASGAVEVSAGQETVAGWDYAQQFIGEFQTTLKRGHCEGR